MRCGYTDFQHKNNVYWVLADCKILVIFVKMF